MRRALLVSLLLVLTLLLRLPPAYAGGIISENFTNDTYNQDLWFLYTQGTGPSTAVTGDRLEITIPADAFTSDPCPFGGVIGTKFELKGDFDVQVDFNLFNWPAPTGVQVGIEPNSRSGFFAGVWLINDPAYSPSPQVYESWLNGEDVRATASEASGKLRMQRVGNTITTYYWDSGWTILGSRTDQLFGVNCGFNFYVFGAGPVSQNFQGKMVQVAFDNLQITYSAFASQNNFNPGGLLLLLD